MTLMQEVLPGLFTALPVGTVEEGTDPVLAAHPWPTNADLIVDCRALRYLNDDDHVLDPTYERGAWWKRWRPEKLTTHNRREDGSDFRHLPYPAGSFDAIAFDPPYVAKGGRASSGIKDMDRRYGQEDCPATPALLQELINDGLTEMARLVRRGGFILVKCQDYTSSGHLWLGTHHTLTHALALGLAVQDRLEHLGGVRPQPARTRKDGQPVRQHHARRNLSTMFVFQRTAPHTVEADA